MRSIPRSQRAVSSVYKKFCEISSSSLRRSIAAIDIAANSAPIIKTLPKSSLTVTPRSTASRTIFGRYMASRLTKVALTQIKSGRKTLMRLEP